jgi:methionyl-tRNA formyltransferase
MRIVFCGTPQFAVPTLAALLDAGDFDVRLVVCQPDRPAGRGLSLTAPAVKQLAVAHGLPVTQPEKIKNNAKFGEQLEAIRPEAIVVVAYGRIIPQWMLELPPLGNINLHASLLPKYRGAAPVQWAIARGETITGVTTIRLDAGLDTGDILRARELPIAQEDTAETLAPKLASLGAALVVETLLGLDSGWIIPQAQDSSTATLAPLLTKEDGLIRFERTATAIWNRLRGFSPWPGAYTSFRGKTLNVWRAWPATASLKPLAPGQLQAHGEHLYVGCGQNTTLELLEVQPQGKKRMTARDFINGYRVKPGEFVIW